MAFLLASTLVGTAALADDAPVQLRCSLNLSGTIEEFQLLVDVPNHRVRKNDLDSSYGFWKDATITQSTISWDFDGGVLGTMAMERDTLRLNTSDGKFHGSCVRDANQI